MFREQGVKAVDDLVKHAFVLTQALTLTKNHGFAKPSSNS